MLVCHIYIYIYIHIYIFIYTYIIIYIYNIYSIECYMRVQTFPVPLHPAVKICQVSICLKGTFCWFTVLGRLGCETLQLWRRCDDLDRLLMRPGWIALTRLQRMIPDSKMFQESEIKGFPLKSAWRSHQVRKGLRPSQRVKDPKWPALFAGLLSDPS